MPQPRGYVDFRAISSEAESLARQAVVSGLGRRDASTALEEVKAANVAQQAAMQAVMAAMLNAHYHGSSWTDIGRALGITKQGAAKRINELDEDALARAVFETRKAGAVVRVPKPMVVLVPTFSWIRDGLERGTFLDGSLRVDGGEAFVQVSATEYLEHHPTAGEREHESEGGAH